ncbi:hypothetical protein Peetri_00066 [Pseudomonas phage vB_PpuM-Peetri]
MRNQDMDKVELHVAVTDEIQGAFNDGTKDYRGCTRERIEDTRALIKRSYVSLREVGYWLVKAFGDETAHDKKERVYRFTEEALELGQATGLTKEEALALVDYVYERPVGEIKQEVGGVMTTLAALCFAHEIDHHECSRLELDRVQDPAVLEKIRIKQANKKIRSPLPGIVKEECQAEPALKGFDPVCSCKDCEVIRYGNRRPNPRAQPVSLVEAVINKMSEDHDAGRIGVTLVVVRTMMEITRIREAMEDKGTVCVVKHMGGFDAVSECVEQMEEGGQLYVIGSKNVMCAGWMLKTPFDVRMYSTCPLDDNHYTQLMSRWWKDGVRIPPVYHYVPGRTDSPGL